jgi:hypothetical protein
MREEKHRAVTLSVRTFYPRNYGGAIGCCIERLNRNVSGSIGDDIIEFFHFT